MRGYRIGEILLIFAFIGCVVFQVFVPPSIGLANDGDFAKMIGRFSLAPGNLDSSEEYKYFTSQWVYKQSYQWVSENHSSELILIAAAALIGWEFSSYIFDIRILGAIHALLWIGCFAALLPLLGRLQGWKPFVPAVAALFIFTDVSYVAYFNSFYTENAAFLFLSWTIVLWLHFMLNERPSVGLYSLFCIASILCVGSKPQHASLGPFLFALAAIAACAFKGKLRRILAIGLGGGILLSAMASYFRTLDMDKLQNQYSVVFFKILKKSANPLEDLRELGLGPENLRYIGYWPAPGAYNPMEDDAWRTGFMRHAGNAGLTRFFLRHPWRALVIAYNDLHSAARERRPPNLGNYEKQYGGPPGEQAKSFGWWSDLRSALFRFAPWHVLVWYVVFIGMAVRRGIRNRNRISWALSMLCVLLTGMALLELAVSSLSSASDTERHLFLFHVITDFTILLAVVWIVESSKLRAVPACASIPEIEGRHAAGQRMVRS
jgi:hypothetical protein